MSDTAEKIPIVCPNCHKQYRVAASLAGKKASCRCGTVIAVEAPGPVEPPPRVPLDELPLPPPEADPGESLLRPPLDDNTSFDEPAAPVVASPTDCASHPGTPAVAACADCHRLICRPCSFPQRDGRNLCSICAIQSASPSVAGSKAFSSTVLIGTCDAHRDVAATARCSYCHALLCPTCDFQFDKSLHLCGRCVTAPPRGMSRCRKLLLIGSLLALSLAVVGTIAKFALSNAIPPEGAFWDEVLNRLAAPLLLAPSIIGLALAFGSFARRAANPPLIWIALSLNTLMVVFWFGMLLVLTFRPLPDVPPPSVPQALQIQTTAGYTGLASATSLRLAKALSANTLMPKEAEAADCYRAREKCGLATWKAQSNADRSICKHWIWPASPPMNGNG